MATTSIKGIIKEVSAIENYSATGRRQTIVVFVPGYVNEYQEKVGKDEMWGIDIFNNRIDHFGLNQNCINKKAEVDVYLSGREWEKDGKKGYSVSVTLKSIKLLDFLNVEPTDKNDDGLHF